MNSGGAQAKFLLINLLSLERAFHSLQTDLKQWRDRGGTRKSISSSRSNGSFFDTIRVFFFLVGTIRVFFENEAMEENIFT